MPCVGHGLQRDHDAANSLYNGNTCFPVEDGSIGLAAVYAGQNAECGGLGDDGGCCAACILWIGLDLNFGPTGIGAAGCIKFWELR